MSDVKRNLVGRNLSPMPAVQLKMVAFSVIVGGISLVPIVFFDSWTLKELSRAVGTIDPASGLIIQDSIILIRNRLIYSYGASFAALLVLSYLGGLFLSQKIVGPIYKLILFLKNQIEGDQSMHFSLRDGDEFRDNLEPLINEWQEKQKSKS